MIWNIIVILVIVWQYSFLMHIADNPLHLFLVIAVIMLIMNLLTSRRVA